MQQIEKTKIIRKLWGARKSETHKLYEIAEIIVSGKKIVRRHIKKSSRDTLNNFLNLCADMEIMIDEFRVKYGVEIESIKVTKLRKLNKRMEE